MAALLPSFISHNIHSITKVNLFFIKSIGNQVNQDYSPAFDNEECTWIAFISIGYETPSCLPLLYLSFNHLPTLPSALDAMFLPTLPFRARRDARRNVPMLLPRLRVPRDRYVMPR